MNELNRNGSLTTEAWRRPALVAVSALAFAAMSIRVFSRSAES